MLEECLLASEYALSAALREPGHPRRDRAAGFVPAVVYGHAVAPMVLRVDEHALTVMLTRGGAHHLVELSIAGESQPRTVVVKEIQLHPVTRALVHVDFQAVSARERIHAEVPLRLLGEDVVTKAGGVLQVVLHQLRITCLPADLPDHADVDVSQLAIGRSLAVRDMKLGAGITVLTDADEVLVRVVAPRAAETVATAPAGEAAVATEEKP